MTFAAPLVLAALAVLPAIWWLLRVTPPRPQTETFPPTRLLQEIAKKDETPSRTPWWLILLRLLLAAVLIVALAGPILSPSDEEAPGEGPLLIVVDNGWASARSFDAITATAAAIVALAADADRPVALVATADPPGQILAPSDPAAVASRLEALAPQPYTADIAALLPQLETIAADAGFGGAVWFTDGLGGDGPEAMAAFLSEAIVGPVEVYLPDAGPALGLASPANTADALTVTVIRQPDADPTGGVVQARDLRGRVIADAAFTIGGGGTAAEAVFDLPTELRNEIVRLDIAGETTAGAVQLLDERYRRRTVGIVSGAPVDVAQPLLSAEYFISRAIAPFADLWTAGEANIDDTIGRMIDSGLSVIVLADIGTLPPDTERRLATWVEAGGTLIRFAGPRLATAVTELLPVDLRAGSGRQLGGALSWEEPQPLGAFPATGPFAGIPVPDDVLVERQVLAEPDAALAGRTWAVLADGTPLVTGGPRGDGLLVLFHVSGDTRWSNLPLSGAFVSMLQTIAGMASAGSVSEDGAIAEIALPPYRVLDGYGRFAEPGPAVEPMRRLDAPIDATHPPGLYGSEGAFRAVSLFGADAALAPFDARALGGNATARGYPTENPVELRQWLLAAVLVLLLVDALAVLWLAGAFGARRAGSAAALVVAGVLLAGGLAPPDAIAQELSEADRLALEATTTTPLAYVLSGNAESDRISDAGMLGLSFVLSQRTAFLPGEPIGVDVATDELAFYPLLYWRIDPGAPLPGSDTIARIDAYMRSGGTILFDTADEIDRLTTELGGTTAAGQWLRNLLATLDLPPLEPVRDEHVLTKTFYLLEDFPGRFAGGDLWVEALPDAAEDEFLEDRPARPGDGVSAILITSNDLAGAWAIDTNGAFLFPTDGAGGARQREMSFRAGINIVMYALTGNYKTDQVHVPALLERLGQ
ncbi:MAG: DUF4159 domain-containing protein [Bauldia sp.]|nr:DUF4159 domain-containing protein [Bauldia sp.]